MAKVYTELPCEAAIFLITRREVYYRRSRSWCTTVYRTCVTARKGIYPFCRFLTDQEAGEAEALDHWLKGGLLFPESRWTETGGSGIIYTDIKNSGKSEAEKAMADRLKVVKEALLLEMRGMAFYSKIAKEATVEEVASFFSMMASEEEKHATLLKQQYNALEAGEKIQLPEDAPSSIFEAAGFVLPASVMRQMSPAGFEAAAISVAIDMETRAIQLYSSRAEAAETPEEKELYEWLTGWEEEHREMLTAIDTRLQERFWSDNSFWPYD